MQARLTPLHLVSVLALGSALPACSDPPPGKLFDEEGAWSVVQYQLDDGLEDIMAMSRKDAFMLSFDAKANVMTTAACGNEMTGFEPTNSPCRASPSTTSWQCSCFSYAFQEEIMQMVQFEAGKTPPEVEFNADLLPGQSGGTGSGESTSGGSGGGGGGTGALTVIKISAIPERADTYDFTPLPVGVFGGNGANHHFIVETRTPARFEEVFDDPDGRAGCKRCYAPPAG
jgi:hypothetical protein